MSARIFYRQLALERCRHNVAQLCAAMHAFEEIAGAGCSDLSATVLPLLEGLNRDLDVIERSFDGVSFAEGSQPAGGGIIIDFVPSTVGKDS
jgi:hypothetical protein